MKTPIVQQLEEKRSAKRLAKKENRCQGETLLFELHFG